MKNIVNVLMLILLGSSASAGSSGGIHNHDNGTSNRKFSRHSDEYCVDEYITLLNTIYLPGSSCYLNESLELRWKTQNYPHLKGNPITVAYWAGSYVRQDTVISTYLKEWIDVCQGKKVLSKKTFAQQDGAQTTFKLKNANLDPSIKESFMLVPITRAQAEAELAKAQKRCLGDSL